MQRLTRARTVLALALVGALALAGCGGGGDNGAEQDLRDQLAMLQTDLDAANAAKMTAEAAQAAAAEAQADAEAAQATAETDRDAANIARGAADQAAANAMAAQAAAEGAQTEAEAAQATAEAAQIAAQTAQATAETDRDAAKAAQMAADAAQATAEAAQVAAVAAQATAETERDAAMAAEMAAMEAQAAAEAAQTAAEQAAATAMAAQAAAEAERDTNAGALAAAEAARNAAKDAEADAKVAQAQAEAAQATAEAAQATAEADSADAMAAQATAEQAAADAMAAQTAAEQAAATAMAVQAAAEAERDTNAEALAAAEAARNAAKDAEADAKVAQAQAEAAQATAEADSADAMAAEATAEQAAADAMAAEATAEQAAADAMAAQGTAEQAAADAMAAQGTAEMERDAAKVAEMAALEAQATAETERDAANTAKMAAEAAQAVAEKAAEDARAAQKTAEDNAKKYMDELAKLRGDVDDTGAMQASAEAKDLLAALMSVTDAVGDLTDGDQSNRDGNPTLAVPEAPSALGPTTVEVTSDGELMVTAPGYAMSDTPADAIEGWRGAELMGSTPGNEGDTLVLYSDIGNDGAESLLDRYTSSLPTPAAPRAYLVEAADDATTGVTAISWSEVTRPDEMTTVGGTSADPITMFAGTVHGIPGTFSCNATGVALCTAPERYSGGAVNDSTDGLPAERATAWSFVPDEGVAIYTDDANYLAFGWWLNKGSDGKPDDVRLLTSAAGLGAMRTDTSTEGATLRGDATYEGAAAGKYAMASQTDDTYEGGHFTAMATLTVDFDADLDPATVDNDRAGVAISGMIDNFRTGDVSRPDWSVKLMVDNDADDTNAVAPVGSLVRDPAADASRMLTEWSTGAAQTGTGTWTADFYDGRAPPAPAGTDIGDAEANTMLPMAVVGTFNAHVGGTGAGAVGRIQGAFGANIME